ncbi:SAM-dependent methyltransferase [Paludibacterium yongneupense]|uniref:SAM-dependent methyltransferase n=1 Tax=Paludibacterium yongneupense TaxID=400061 RepID=UPI00040B0E9A|nr:class I SAM-dependent methyltransferase [Paludibacterium yongneupense]
MEKDSPESSGAAPFWHARFDREDYVYGTEANDFLREQAPHLGSAATVLSLGEGEGRNAVFLARLGHRVTALEAAQAGIRKIHALAARRGVTVATLQTDLADYRIAAGQWQGIVSIFCHLPPALRREVLGQVVAGLECGGVFIMEGYTPRQLAHGTGGPKDGALLLEPATIRAELDGLDLLHFAEVTRPVIEGSLHTGTAAVLQVVALKP